MTFNLGNFIFKCGHSYTRRRFGTGCSDPSPLECEETCCWPHLIYKERDCEFCLVIKNNWSNYPPFLQDFKGIDFNSGDAPELTERLKQWHF